MIITGNHEPAVNFDYDEIDRGNPLAAIIHEPDSEAFRVAAVESKDFFRRLWMVVQDYRGDKALANDCAMFAVGWFDLARAHSQEEIAVRHQCERANVNRLVIKIQKLLGIPPMIGQRCDSARRKFSAIRKQQLK